jgi:hypothetical protein
LSLVLCLAVIPVWAFGGGVKKCSGAFDEWGKSSFSGLIGGFVLQTF